MMIVLTLIFGACANDEAAVPKLNCNQPDFETNKTVAEIQETTSKIVSQYLYDDVIEAYVVSSDENGNFSKPFRFKLWLQQQRHP